MKPILIIALISGFLSCKKTNPSLNSHSNKNSYKIMVPKRDTLIKFSQNLHLYFGTFDYSKKLWKDPVFISNTKDTTVIKNWDLDWGSELDIRFSPNKKYLVLDAIIIGDLSDGDKEDLYENYTCQLISTTQTAILDSFQENCDGQWNTNNEWVVNGEVVFIGSDK